MRTINTSLNAIVGASIQGSESQRWFIDLATGRVFLVSLDFQGEEEIERILEIMKQDLDRYMPIPYLSQDDFLKEVDMYSRYLSDAPALQKLLLEAVEKNKSRDYIIRILNRSPGQGKKFGEFLRDRIRHRVQTWLDSVEIKLALANDE
jgi:hypothetical protein